MRRDVAAIPVSVILLVALTVAVTGAATTVLLLQEPSQDQVASGFTLKDGERVEILKTSGDPLDAEPTRLYIGTPRGSASLSADEMPGVGETWANGQRVCLAGDGPRCMEIVGAEDIIDVRITHVDQTLFAWDDIEVDDLAAGDGPRLSITPEGEQDTEDADEDDGTVGEPDLRLVSLDPDEEEPEEGDEVTFSLTVANVGSQASAEDVRVRVQVDDETHETLSLASLDAGASTTLQTTVWIAEGGSHAVSAQVDPDAEVDDADRGNNADVTSLAVASEDPGHAYEDVDNDAMFTPGTDLAIPDEDVHDGEYHVQDPWSLVIPEAVGPIDADAVNYTAGSEGHVVIETDVTSGDEGIHIEAGVFVRAEDVTFTSNDEGIVLEANDGPVAVNGSTLETTDERVELITAGDVHARGAVLSTTDERVIVDAGGAVDLTDATVEAHERIPITAGDDVIVEDAALSAQETVTIDTIDAATIHADGVSLDDEDSTAVVTPEAATIQGEPAQGDVAHEGDDGDGEGGGGGAGDGKDEGAG